MSSEIIKSAYRACLKKEFNSWKELDAAILEICNDIAVDENIRVSILTARHTYAGFCDMLTDYFGDDSQDKLENAYIGIGWAFKSQSYDYISDGIRQNVANGARFVILDRCVDDVSRYAELAAELDISMIAMDVIESMPTADSILTKSVCIL